MGLLSRLSSETHLPLVFVLCSLYLTVHSASYEEVVRTCRTEASGVRFYQSLKCNSYFMCNAGRPLLRNCPPGTQFDPKIRRCNTMGYSCKNQILYGHHIVDTRHSVRSNHIQQPSNRNSGEYIIKDSMLKVKSLIRAEVNMARRMEGVVDSGPYRYVSAFLYAKPIAKHMSHCAHVLMEAHKLMKRRRGITSRYLKVLRLSSKTGIPDAKQTVSREMDECPYPKTFNCDKSSWFRTSDGSCNNLQRPILGRSNVPHRRLVRPNYGDGIDTMRKATQGGVLPHARDVSRHLFADMNHPSSVHTLLLMTWSQFIDHDLSRTAITMCAKDEDGFGQTTEVTCGNDGCQKEGEGLEACWPIPVSVDDQDFGHTNRCIKFVRSEATPPLDCRSAHREQLNQVTPWIDGSNIYGSTPEEAKSVRLISNTGRGQLKMRPHPKGHHWKSMLPSFDEELCRGTNSTIRCFLAGDERVNENSALTTMHTVWVREHNRIEEQLHNINPKWSGERLFQEARRIVIALMQHVVINEQMPLVLGQELTTSYDISPATGDYYYGYSSRFDPRMSQGFATAAYRFGHTLIQDRFSRVHGHGKGKGKDLMLSDSFFRPVHVYDIKQGGMDAFLRGLTSQGAQTFDNFFTKQISRSLFTERPPHGPGMDLLALNIQRGRDHGLPSYNEYRQFCGLGRLSTFDELTRDIADNHTRTIIQRLYRHPDDIDLFAGGICERPVPGGMVGPTFGCIIGDQIRSLRKGDRFWYENKSRLGFTKAQLKEIRKVRLSKVICTNSDNVDMIQPWVLLKPLSEVNKRELNTATRQKFYTKHGNAHVKCSSLPDLDLRKWREY